MARETKRLTAVGIKALSTVGLHADGDSLYLRVDAAGAKRWVLLFRWPDPKTGKLKRTEMGLGPLADVGLADAREKAAHARRLIAEGTNPIEARATIAAARAKPVVTFGQMAEQYIAAHASSFRNKKHLEQWRMTLSVQKDPKGAYLDTGYCLSLRDKPVDKATTEDVLMVLEPIWLTKSETASRVRGRIENVFDAAKAKKLREGENPAQWKGNLKTWLAKRPRLTRGHHKAMPWAELPAFMSKLRTSEGMGAKALEYLILTVSRTGEVIGAAPSEFDLDAALWTVPAERMKAGREHRVALTPRAVELVRDLTETNPGASFVFSATARRPISNATMTKALRTAGGGDYTVHGMRSAFRDWISEETAFPDNLAEAALAHRVGDETELAYKRGDVLAKRRKMMAAWERYCLQPDRKNVVPIGRKASAA